MQPHQSILEYRSGRYLKALALLCVACVAAYLGWGQPQPPLKAYGGTPTGYVLGVLASLMVLWLMALGLRKRHYRSRAGSVQGWTSAHVYLGSGVVLVAALHCGFEFGWNIHTLAFALLVGVVGSGVVGVVAYLRLPQRMTANLAGATPDLLLDRLAAHEAVCRRLASDLSPPLQVLVQRACDAAVRRALQGGRWWGGRVLGRSEGPVFDMRPELIALGLPLDAQQRPRHDQLVTEFTRLAIAVEQIRDDLRLRLLMRGWLLAHVPLSFALLAALIAHVVSVFYFW